MSGFAADAAWDMASDRDVWRAQRPIAGQAVQWVSEWVIRYYNTLNNSVILVIIFQLQLSYSFDFLVIVILLVNYKGIF